MRTITILIGLFFWGIQNHAQENEHTPADLITSLEFNSNERDTAVEQSLTKDEFERIIEASISSGNEIKLSQFFSNNIELQILDKQNLYSKSQAQQILKLVFQKNEPEEFIIQHRGVSGKMDYLIGEYRSGSDSFRITLMHTTNKELKAMIKKLMIEKINSD